jgi:hypothetical protein
VDERAAELRRRDDFGEVAFVGDVATPGRHTPLLGLQRDAGVVDRVRVAHLLGELALAEAEIAEQVRQAFFLDGMEPGLADEGAVDAGDERERIGRKVVRLRVAGVFRCVWNFVALGVRTPVYLSISPSVMP